VKKISILFYYDITTIKIESHLHDITHPNIHTKIIKEDFDTKLCLRRYPAVNFLNIMNVTNVLQDSLVNLISLNMVILQIVL